MLPDCEHLAETVRVIDLQGSTGGRVLRVLMNSELDEAVGILSEASDQPGKAPIPRTDQTLGHPEVYWRWRMQMAEKIAVETDPERFGVVAMYVIGSTKNASAGPSSDIDLLVHFRGTDEQRGDLETWLEAWSLCLGEINYLRTGYANRELLDVHIISDEDIEKKTSFATKIGAVTDAALELKVGAAAD
jgi:predicted nucleotidyltransferase